MIILVMAHLNLRTPNDLFSDGHIYMSEHKELKKTAALQLCVAI
jgi:hypothetical protein